MMQCFWLMFLFLGLLPRRHSAKLEEMIELPNELEDMDISADDQERIINGYSATDGQFPYAVAIEFQGVYICTGFLIGNRTVLTAGHCVFIGGQLQSAPAFRGKIGSANRTSSNAVTLQFSAIVLHPQYNDTTLRNDIAVLKVSSPNPIPVNNRIDSIPIAAAGTPIDGYALKIAIVMGWGTIVKSGENRLPDILQYVKNVVKPQKSCQRRFPNDVTNNIMCGYSLLDKGICRGDSGGPFVYFRKLINSPLAIGVTSFISAERGCGGIPSYSFFTRTANYEAWIKEVANDAGIKSS